MGRAPIPAAPTHISSGPIGSRVAGHAKQNSDGRDRSREGPGHRRFVFSETKARRRMAGDEADQITATEDDGREDEKRPGSRARQDQHEDRAVELDRQRPERGEVGIGRFRQGGRRDAEHCAIECPRKPTSTPLTRASFRNQRSAEGRQLSASHCEFKRRAAERLAPAKIWNRTTDSKHPATAGTPRRAKREKIRAALVALRRKQGRQNIAAERKEDADRGGAVEREQQRRDREIAENAARRQGRQNEVREEGERRVRQKHLDGGRSSKGVDVVETAALAGGSANRGFFLKLMAVALRAARRRQVDG